MNPTTLRFFSRDLHEQNHIWKQIDKFCTIKFINIGHFYSSFCVPHQMFYLLKNTIRTKATIIQTQHLQLDFVCSLSLRDSDFKFKWFPSVSLLLFSKVLISLRIIPLAIVACSLILHVSKRILFAIFSCILLLCFKTALIESSLSVSTVELDSSWSFLPEN